MPNRLTRVLAVVGALALFAMAGCLVGLVTMAGDGFNARQAPSAMEAKVARTARSLATPARIKAKKNPFEATPEVLAEAKHHWASHCAVCHANDGSGDTQIGRNLSPRAPDMRSGPTQDLSDGELYAAIENGIRLTGMPAWGDGRETDEESWHLVALIRHLPRLTPEELAEMNKQNPRTAEEWREEQEEEEFLRGGDAAVPKDPSQPHHH